MFTEFINAVDDDFYFLNNSAQSYNTASTEITMLEKEKSKLKGQVDKLINQMETMKVEYEDKLKDLRKLLETEKNSTRVLQIKLKYERRARFKK